MPNTRLVRQAGDVLGEVGHHVERVGDADDDGVGRGGDDLRDHALDDRLVRGEQVVAGHAGLAGQAGGHDDDVAAGGVGVVVGADDGRAEALDRAHVHHVERLALRQALGDVDHDDVGDLVQQQELGGGRADLSRADDGHLRIGHESPLPCEKRRGEAARGLERAGVKPA